MKTELVVSEMSLGRPSKYDPRFASQLIEHMASGLSFESFAGVVGVSARTLHNWRSSNADFEEAKAVGLEANRLWWERVGLSAVHGHVPGFNAASWIFNMKNRFHWRDKFEPVDPKADDVPECPYPNLTDDERAQLATTILKAKVLSDSRSKS